MKTNLALFGMLSVFAVTGCHKKFDIDELIVTTTDAGVLDTVTMAALTSLSKNGEPANIDTYEWTITDPDGNNVPIISQEDNTVTWIPQKEGGYAVQVKAVSGTKKQTKVTQTIFENRISTFQKALVGEWEGSCYATFFSYGPRTVHFSIEANGHYKSHMVSAPEPGSGVAFTTLTNGVDEWDHADKKFAVNDILENGEAKGTIKFIHWGGELLTYLFDKMTFSENYDTLKFNSGHFEPENLNVEYVLTRQD